MTCNAGLLFLRIVSQLQVLDLSCNEIADIETQELPRNLIILNLAENPCSLIAGFYEKFVSTLPKLMVSYTHSEAGHK